MHFISQRAVLAVIISSAGFLGLHTFSAIHLWMFMAYMTIIFFSFGLIFGNVNAMAMEPMGHVAGIASAIIGSVSSVISLVIGTFIGQMYNDTLIPMTLGFFSMTGLAFFMMKFADRNNPNAAS